MVIKTRSAVIFAIIVLLLIIGYSYYSPAVSKSAVPFAYSCNADSDCVFNHQAWALSSGTRTESCCLNTEFLATATPAVNENNIEIIMYGCATVNCTCVENKCEAAPPVTSS